MEKRREENIQKHLQVSLSSFSFLLTCQVWIHRLLLYGKSNSCSLELPLLPQG